MHTTTLLNQTLFLTLNKTFLKGEGIKFPSPFFDLNEEKRMKEYLVITGYAQPVYRKCELCKKVKDVNYRMDVKHAESPTMLTGSLELCKVCASNLGEIIQK